MTCRILALLDAAKQDPLPFRRVYVLDTSRVARDTLQAQGLKFYLRKKRGIELVFLHLPQTGSYMDEAIEKMMEVWDELHSRMSKAKGVEGQKQHVRRGYRAGGEAPYGYRRRVVVIGQHRSGQPITKSVNEPDPETAPVVQEYFRRRASGESRRGILCDFKRRAIPSPSGRADLCVLGPPLPGPRVGRDLLCHVLPRNLAAPRRPRGRRARR